MAENERLLDRVTWPEDLKQIAPASLPRLCEEMREFILDNVTKTGGHLGSGMGAVELTVALHYAFDFREDRLILERLRAAFGERTFADARIPLHLTATDFRTGEQVVLSQAPLVPAIRASIAVPFIFAPYQVDCRLLVDGFLPLNKETISLWQSVDDLCPNYSPQSHYCLLADFVINKPTLLNVNIAYG